MPKKIIEEISRKRKETIVGKKILIIGISYKPNIADIRESPALRLIEELRSQGNEVIWHDPLVKTWRTESSADLNKISNVDFVVVSILHDGINLEFFTNFTTNVYDLTGKIDSST
jgi:UDP-N-acetyl-D-glucosamine dehydrogenase